MKTESSFGAHSGARCSTFTLKTKQGTDPGGLKLCDLNIRLRRAKRPTDRHQIEPNGIHRGYFAFSNVSGFMILCLAHDEPICGDRVNDLQRRAALFAYDVLNALQTDAKTIRTYDVSKDHIYRLREALSPEIKKYINL